MQQLPLPTEDVRLRERINEFIDELEAYQKTLRYVVCPKCKGEGGEWDEAGTHDQRWYDCARCKGGRTTPEGAAINLNRYGKQSVRRYLLMVAGLEKVPDYY